MSAVFFVARRARGFFTVVASSATASLAAFLGARAGFRAAADDRFTAAAGSARDSATEPPDAVSA